MTEIPFKKPELSDRETILSHLKNQGFRGCERTFANIYLWARFYGLVWAELEGTIVFRSMFDGKYSYTYPAGDGDRRAAVERLIREEEGQGYPLQFHGLSRKEYEELEQYFPGQFEISWPRDVEDYVYETEKLIQLSGKKYHGKKNHINQFKAAYPDWSYEPLTDDNVEECFQMALRWREFNGCEGDPEKNKEMCVALNSLRLQKELELQGGVLRAGGEVVAFTMGEPVSEDTFVVHIEKAYADIRGAYPMINQQFLEHEVSRYTYVNREDDTGNEGLRKAKLSYHPAFMVEKGTAVRKGENV
ncbi:MAG: DUF2156 domain-containing protein [Lachnospiraceae bacterium]|mgnify:CR=1 FL=1|jgi:hypothetical protein|nr:DUF2156 domain-containing protein [Lachnospiraceae bacterium]